MKSYTDIEQSKKLAEILPVESVDQIWERIAIAGANLDVPEKMEYWHNGDTPYFLSSRGGVPCWSLAALLGVLPPYLFEFERGIDLNVYPNLNGKGWHCSYMPNAIENMKNDKFKQITNGDNLIDAVFEMILKLKEKDLL